MFLYTSEIKKIIHNFKYEDYGYYARAMGIKMAEFFQNLNLVYIDGIISVPIHWKRERERGFNQVDIIANEISKICKIPLIKNVLIRTKNTKPQFNLNKTKRIENINGAFDIIDKTKILGKNILLIDDIYTTGTTLKECIKILKENGAENVYYFTLASTKTFVK